MQLSGAFTTSRILIICVKCWLYNIEKIVNVYPPLISELQQSNTGQHHMFFLQVYMRYFPRFQNDKKTLHCYSLFEMNPQNSKTKSHLVKIFNCNIQYKTV